MITFSEDTDPKIMGIVNVTPDSFSGDGAVDINAVVTNALALQEAGADILDIGGESTRPGSVPVTGEEEQRRVIPVIKELSQCVACPISIDTYRADTAAAALAAGASIINDVKGGSEPGMLELIAERGCPVILMHNMAASVDDDQRAPSFTGKDRQNFMPWLLQQLHAIVDRAMMAGVTRDQLILDPGIGFGKTVEQNLQVIQQAGWLEQKLSLPILLGFSNKSFIGKVLEVNVDQRLAGNLACVAAADCSYLRMHDVAGTKQFLAMRAALADTDS